MAQDVAGMTANQAAIIVGALMEFSMALEDCSGLACQTILVVR